METYKLAFAVGMVVEALGVFGGTALYFTGIIDSVTVFAAIVVAASILAAPVHLYAYKQWKG